MIDLAFKRVNHLNQIHVPKDWLKDFEEQRILMYSQKEQEQAVMVPELIYKKLDITPLILVIPTINKDTNIMTIKKKIRKKLQIKENDLLQLAYNKKLKIIVFSKVKIAKIERKFEKEFAQFFSDSIVQQNIKLINKLDKQEKERKDKK